MVWDHTYNISEYYIHLIVDGELSWTTSSSVSSDFNDSLENSQNHMHEVSLRKCVLTTNSLCHVATETIDLPIYEGLLELSKFLLEI